MKSKYLLVNLLWILVVGVVGVGCSDDAALDKTRPPASIVSFSAEPPHLDEPGNVLLSWETADAKEITLLKDGVDVAPDEELPALGSVEVMLEASATFELIAAGEYGPPASKTLTVQVDPYPVPAIASFTAPEKVAANELGVAAVTVSWTGVTEADELILEATGQAHITLDPAAGSDGSYEFEIEADTTFTLIARGRGGEVEESATTALVAYPSIDSFTIDRAWVGQGEAVLLQWETQNAATVELILDGVAVEEVDASATNGSHEHTAFLSGTFELVASNELDVSISETLSFVVDQPEIEVFAGTEMARWLGQPLELSWITHGGRNLELFVTGEEEPICASDEVDVIDEAACSWELPGPGDYAFTLVVSNGSGTVSSTWGVSAGTGPVIADFDVDPKVVTLGDPLTVTWTTLPDPDGEYPSLSLVHDLGGSYEISGPAGSEEVFLEEPGTYVFTLYASTSNPLSVAVEESVVVEVHSLPVVSLSVDPTHFDEAEAEHVTFSWTSEHASSLKLVQLGDDSHDELELLDVPEDERASGTFHYRPTRTASYELIATNAAGAVVASTVEVTLAPPRVVEFRADPSDIVGGQELELSWRTEMGDAVRLDILDSGYLVEDTQERFIDISTLGAQRLHMTTECFIGSGTPVLNHHGCVAFDLPGGFAFPFGGADQTKVRVFGGLISFSPDTIPTENPGDNKAFPTTNANYHFAHLAPFWDALVWPPDEYPTGNLHVLHREDPAGDSVIVQWTDISLNGTYYHPTVRLNFQVILWENGDFEYRYGKMSYLEGDEFQENFANGSSATIGFQTPDRQSFVMLGLNQNVRIRGPLYNRSFRFRKIDDLPSSGSLAWSPYSAQDSMEVTLTVSREGLDDSRTQTITVRERPAVTIELRPTEPVRVNSDFRIGWSTERATLVQILDGSGEEVCRVENQAEVEQGFCTLQEPTEGDHEYTIRVSGMNGVYVDRDIPIRAYIDFGIISFEADEEDVEVGEGVTLSWQTFGATSLRIEANGVEVPLTDVDLEDGSVFVPSVMVDTTFVLQIRNALGMVLEETITVETWSIEFKMTPRETKVRPGDPVIVDVVATSLDGGAPPRIFGTLPLSEQTGPGTEYSDISTMDNAVELYLSATASNTINDIEFPEGFTFPYFEESYDRARLHVDGYISFSTASNTTYNQRLPFADSASYQGVHLAPFWDDLHPRSDNGAPVGSMWTLHDGDRFIIQWKNMSLNTGSANGTGGNPPRTHDLNFQVVLHRDGTFEYRYGNMKGLPEGLTNSSCYPSSCENEANAAAATIGYQEPTGKVGLTLHYGGTNHAAENLPFPGGLSNRSFIYQPQVGSGTITLNPSRTTTYEFCTYSGERKVCKSFEIVAEFGIESFEPSLTSAPLGTTVTLSWRTEGGKELRVYAGGDLIHTVTEPALIDEGFLDVNPTSNTTYTIEVEAPFNFASASVDVEVLRIGLEATASSSSVFPGTPLTLSWNLDVRDPLYQPILITPMEEISGPGTEFFDLDIATDPGAQTLLTETQGSNLVRLDFEDGFTFPYLGEEMSFVRVSSEGYLSFSDTGSNSSSNQILPNSANAYRGVHIAPFWDDLHPRGVGRVYAKRTDPDTYVIQWHRTSLSRGSSTANPGELSFMVVLRQSGEFEFRYGMMRPPANPATSANDCSPLSCINETNGSSATIGYQDTAGAVAYMLHYGGGNPSPANRPVGGGLSNRSWKYTPRAASGSVQIAPWDTTEYVVCSLDGVTRDVFCAEPVVVETEWGIHRFEASPAAVLRDHPVTLSWDVEGLDELVIYADGVELQRYTRATMPLTGTFSHTPNITTTYTLEGTSLGRTVVEERLVELRTLNFNLTPPAGRHFPGDTISVNWSLEALEPGPYAVTSPMIEIDASPGAAGAFQDISGLPDAIDAVLSSNNGHTTHTLPFDFPYFGNYYRDIRVHVNGFLSFDAATTTIRSTNLPLPTPATDRHIHLAIFWDQLFRRGPDKIWLYQPDPDSFIIQWTNFNRTGGSSATNLYDLNFQIVLFSDGAFEYRYGKMAPPPPPFSNSTCYPDTCELEANGSSATIGYQTPDGSYGYTFHYGGNNRDAVRELPGGLNNRSFRFQPALSGTTQFVLERSQDVLVCASVATFRECKSVYVEAVADPGDLAITEMMIDPAGGASKQWFEVRNLSKRFIDLEGFEIRTNAGTHKISSSLSVGAGEYLTFASSSDVGFTPSYVYGDLPMGTQVDTLSVDAGTASITSVNWAASWTVPADATLFLDPSYLVQGIVSHNAFDRWCEGSSAGTPGQRSVGCKSPYYDVETYSSLPFIDISTIGTKVDDMVTWYATTKIPLPGFSIPFFDGTVSDVWATSDGLVGFGPTSPGSETNPPSSLPRTTTIPQAPFFGVLWDTYICNPDRFPCAFHYHRGTFNGQEMVILQWTGFKREHSYGSFYPGTATFQAQIWLDGTLVTATADVHPDDVPGSDAWRYYRGGNTWVGIEGVNGDYASGHFRTETDMSHRTIVFTRK